MPFERAQETTGNSCARAGATLAIASIWANAAMLPMIDDPNCRDTLNDMSLENPFQDPLRFERRIPECTVVIFGANGDLTKRKLLPALYRLAYERRLSPGFAVVGVSRTAMTDDDF